MRTSISLTSFFSSLRSSTLSSHILIPIIRIISPPDPPPPRLSPNRGGIRRWRGALGTLGDLTLQLPSQGLTSGARLALARQGCATGSFRLNCSESLYVKDSRGLAMFQRIELEEELDKARLGLRERPPMKAAASLDTTDLPSSPEALSTSSGIADCAGRKTRRPSMRTQKRNMLASQNLRFESGGLSSCATFTEGLCNLEDYIRASEADSPPSIELPVVHSVQEISQLSASGDTPNLSWLDSLRRKAFPTTDRPPTVKKRRSTGGLVKSLSCVDLDASFSEADFTFNVDTSSSSSDDSTSLMDGQVKKTCNHLDEDDGFCEAPTNKLRREGSWTRLRRRISKRWSVNHSDSATDVPTLDSSIGIASGLVQFFQQGMPSNFIQPSIHVFS